MKRIKSIFALTLAFLLILSLAACGGNTKTAETTAANTNEKSAVQETDKQAAGSGTGFPLHPEAAWYNARYAKKKFSRK